MRKFNLLLRNYILRYMLVAVLILFFKILPAQVHYTIPVSQAPELIANAGVDAQINSGQSIQIGAFQTATGGCFPYNYFWTPSVNIDNAIIANPIASPVISTIFTVKVTDSLGCEALDSVLITILPSGMNFQINNSDFYFTNSNNLLTLHTDFFNSKRIEIGIFSITGKKNISECLNIQEGKTSYSIDINKLSSGMYIAFCKSADGMYFQKIII